MYFADRDAKGAEKPAGGGVHGTEHGGSASDGDLLDEIPGGAERVLWRHA